LKLNVKKSEVMAVGRKAETLHITADGSELKQVKSFCYLGATFDSSANKETAINERIGHYSKNAGMLYPLSKDKYVPRDVKVVIFTTILRPIMTHGCEAWTLMTN